MRAAQNVIEQLRDMVLPAPRKPVKQSDWNQFMTKLRNTPKKTRHDAETAPSSMTMADNKTVHKP